MKRNILSKELANRLVEPNPKSAKSELRGDDMMLMLPIDIFAIYCVTGLSRLEYFMNEKATSKLDG